MVQPADASSVFAGQANSLLDRRSVRIVTTLVLRVIVRVVLEVRAVQDRAEKPGLGLSNRSTARRAAWRLVMSAPTTKRTPVVAWAMTDASATAMTGGESITTQSKCSCHD